jgi:hypothetical protein
MNVDMLEDEQEQHNQDAETLKEVQPKNTEETSRVNGMMKSQEAVINPGESQIIMSDHQLEGIVKDVMG